MKSVLLYVSMLGMIACGPSRNITGIYRNNFAFIGFFGTRISLNSDSTFGYRMQGDLMSDSATGIYHVKGRKLILLYNPEPVASLVEEMLKSGLKDTRHKEYYIGHNKLFTRYKKEQGYSRHKRYLLWGHHYMTTRRYYLKRISK